MSATDTDDHGHADADDAEYGYTEWRCTNCGHGVPKNNPPCDRCGNMAFEQAEVRASDFDDEIRAASTLQVARENARLLAAGGAVILVAVLVVLASTGTVVLADPVGLGYRYGAVTPAEPDDDGSLTAAELHGRVAAEYDDTSLQWYGRGLELSYVTTADSDEAVVAGILQVATWYAEYVDGGGDAASLQVTVEVRGEGRGRVTIDRADAAAFAAGDIGETEYRSRVLGSQG